jgi:tetratricopeptide (TPR) repeat protein
MVASGNRRELRVFVSSTFRDMMAERDELIKRVFPALRKLCAERGVTWGEFDLRWGITEEQQEQGQVLPICFDVIERCRPYFIGILGERYGSVPSRLPPELIDREPWLGRLAGRSVTELEILHGVLNNPEMGAHARFYLRSSAYTESLPAEEQAEYREVTAEGERKLTDLKGRIRVSGFPVHENYLDARALGDLVLADFTSLIDALFPASALPDTLARERVLHEAFAESRSRVTVGREPELARIDAHIDGDNRPLAILGAPGLGKSALLATWAVRYRTANPTAHILEHYVGATADSTDWMAMLRRIIGEFNRDLGLAFDIPDRPDELTSTFAKALSEAARHRKVVLVIDALNQLADRDQSLDLAWLPPAIPTGLRLIVSTLPGRVQDEVVRRGWPTLIVPPLGRDERAELVVKYLAEFGKVLAADRIKRIVDAEQTANPLYLRALLDELRVWGDNSRLDARVSHYLAARDIPELFRRVLERYEGDYERDRPGLVGDALGLLWCAREGLSEPELLDLLGPAGRPLSHATWAKFYLGAENALISRSGLLSFSHEFLREAVRQRYLANEERQGEVRRQLASYFAGQPRGVRQIDELPWQLAELGAWNELARLFADLGFLHYAWERSPHDVRRSWASVEARSANRMIHRYRRLIRRPADYVGPEAFQSTLMELLISTGHNEEGLRLADHLASVANDRERLTALAAKANILKIKGELDQALAIYDECARVAASQNLPPQLAAMLGNRATIMLQRGEYHEALALYDEQERLSREHGYPPGVAAAIGNKAIVLRHRGDLDGALALYQQAERMHRELGQQDALVTQLGNQAVILISRGDLNGAQEMLREAERSAREFDNRSSLQNCLGNQVTVELYRGNLDEALRLCQEREIICREIGDKDGLRATLGDLATIFGKRGNIDHALELLAAAERLCRELGEPPAIHNVLLKRASLLATGGKVQESLQLLKEQEAICRALGEKHGLYASLEVQAGLAGLAGNAAAAETLLNEAEQLCRELDDRHGLQSVLGQRGLLLLEAGAPAAANLAFVLFDEQEKICRESGYTDGLQVALGNKAAIFAQHGHLDVALRLHQEEEQICRTREEQYALQVSLGNQAGILARLKRYELARKKFEEQERICRQLKIPEGLAQMLTNYGMMLAEDLGRPTEALPLIEEAYALMTAHGLSQSHLAQRIKPALDYVRGVNL